MPLQTIPRYMLINMICKKTFFNAVYINKYAVNHGKVLSSALNNPSQYFIFFNYSNNSGENMVLGYDPLQSEPKPKRIKKSLNGYLCSQCENIASKASHLKKHFESKHEEVRHPCLLCEYVATIESVKETC